MKKAEVEKKTLKIEDVKFHPKNPKKHWDEGLRRSIEEMGYVEPIVVDENNQLLAGHGRIKILKDKGYKKVDAIVVDGLSEAQKEKYLLFSNKIGERGGWDSDLLSEFTEDVLLETGFDERDVALLLEQELEVPEMNEAEDEFDVPEVRVVIDTSFAKFNREVRDFLEDKFGPEINIEVS